MLADIPAPWILWDINYRNGDFIPKCIGTFANGFALSRVKICQDTCKASSQDIHLVEIHGITDGMGMYGLFLGEL